MLHISALDIANFIEHEEFHTNDSFNGRVRITQEGLNLLKTIVKYKYPAFLLIELSHGIPGQLIIRGM